MKDVQKKEMLPTFQKQRNEFLTPIDQWFDEMVSNFFPSSADVGIKPFESYSYPKVDIKEYDNNINITADIAGMNKDDVKIAIKDDVLTISGKKTYENTEEDGGTYLKREIKKSQFSRSFQLNDNMDKSSVNATFKDGLLKLIINKIKPAIPDVIDVEIKEG
jgi:HSP20 family protein